MAPQTVIPMFGNTTFSRLAMNRASGAPRFPSLRQRCWKGFQLYLIVCSRAGAIRSGSRSGIKPEELVRTPPILRFDLEHPLIHASAAPGCGALEQRRPTPSSLTFRFDSVALLKLFRWQGSIKGSGAFLDMNGWVRKSPSALSAQTLNARARPKRTRDSRLPTLLISRY